MIFYFLFKNNICYVAEYLLVKAPEIVDFCHSATGIGLQGFDIRNKFVKILSDRWVDCKFLIKVSLFSIISMILNLQS
jgi:hypothetical protein